MASIAIGLSGLFPSLAHAQLPTGNLLTNPGAESGSITGWTVNGALPATPTVDSGSFDPGINPNTGSFDFVGGNGASGELDQSVSLIGAGITAGQIDAGNLFANVSFFEQGLNQGTPSDDAQVGLEFFNGSSVSLGTASTPFIDSHNLTWQNFVGSFAIPVGTRTITYSMIFQRNAGSDLDSFIDDNSLSISAAPIASAAAPEPGSIALAAVGALPLAGMVIRRRRRSA